MEISKEKLQKSVGVVDGVDSKSCYMQKFRLYETRSRFYMIGRDKSRTFWRVLKIDRLEPSELNIVEDPTLYSEAECCDILKRIHDGNKSTGGLKFVTTCYGIIGFIKFLEPYYMLLITKRKKIGTICGHDVYAITKSEMVPIPHPSVRSKLAYSKDENRSLVNFTCTCNVSRIHFRRRIRVALRTILCPLYLAEDYVINYVFLFELIKSCSENVLLDHRCYTRVTYLLICRCLQCICTMRASSSQPSRLSVVLS
ncbi:variant 8, suppressor of actin mutation [Lathyrus oleraceus]|uniref:Variant 8, suppressor of actin mutation n=1 Tax=Pisum sativum TaxID=3888 RepID=A0A9D4XNS8_PEA|nr:variant 8, suppressor of actin mutation [Pisum sativum]